MAYLPAGVPNSRIRRDILSCTSVLKEFQVKTLCLQSADETLDAYPLACLYNFGVQILALRESQNSFGHEIYLWRKEVQRLKALTSANVDDIGVVLAETHEILIFATLTNRIHPSPTFTPLSIEHAVEKARESPFLREASHVVSLLKAAFSIQRELERFEISRHESTHVISNAVSLPRTAVRVAGEWYKNYELSVPDAEKVS